MEFVPVDLAQDHALCLAFRRDAYVVSYGHEDGFSQVDVDEWFNHLDSEPLAGFYLVKQQQHVIGMLEFRSDLRQEDGVGYGYINLIYLVESWRNKGLGTQLLAFCEQHFARYGAQQTHLRVIPGNLAAERFYAKHGFVAQEAAGERGQRLVRKFA